MDRAMREACPGVPKVPPRNWFAPGMPWRNANPGALLNSASGLYARIPLPLGWSGAPAAGTASAPMVSIATVAGHPRASKTVALRGRHLGYIKVAIEWAGPAHPNATLIYPVCLPCTSETQRLALCRQQKISLARGPSCKPHLAQRLLRCSRPAGGKPGT